MELVKWSLNAIDTIFSSRSSGPGEATCPDGTQMSGYTMDAWDKWRIVCQVPLSLEDVEDIYIFGTMIVGFLLFGLCFGLLFREIKKVGVVVKGPQKLPNRIDMVGRAVGTHAETINRSLDAILDGITALRSEFAQRPAQFAHFAKDKA